MKSFAVDRRGTIIMIKELTFPSTFEDAQNVIPNASDPSSCVTFHQVMSMLGEQDVYLVDWLSSRQ